MATASQTVSTIDYEALPPLGRDPAFLGMIATQFFGAFNDNLYKQLLLLIALDYKQMRGLESDPYQFLALLAFAVPFVMLSGFAGFLSDRLRKRRVVIASKILEIIVMLLAVLAFTTGNIGSDVLLFCLFAVLFLMGAQSAVFGPSKYGILPEMLRDSDLPRANGLIQMTTFLAIILGTGVSGFLKLAFEGQLWIVSAICVGIAIAGTLTSLLLRSPPVANPGMKLTADCLIIEKSAWAFIRSDQALFWTLAVYVLFWFAGAVFLPTVNLVCVDQLGFPDSWAGVLLGVLSIGISLGCVVCGKLSKNQVRFDLMRSGGWGLFVTTGVTSLVCALPIADPTVHAVLIGVSLFSIGFFSGVFAVPPQVFIQTRPPDSSKGRVIGAMNLLTWLGITGAAGYYYAVTWGLAQVNLDYSWTYLTIGLMFLVSVLLFRQANVQLKSDH